jgi:hypothetical protein
VIIKLHKLKYLTGVSIYNDTNKKLSDHPILKYVDSPLLNIKKQEINIDKNNKFTNIHTFKIFILFIITVKIYFKFIIFINIVPIIILSTLKNGYKIKS